MDVCKYECERIGLGEGRRTGVGMNVACRAARGHWAGSSAPGTPWVGTQARPRHRWQHGVPCSTHAHVCVLYDETVLASIYLLKSGKSVCLSVCLSPAEMRSRSGLKSLSLARRVCHTKVHVHVNSTQELAALLVKLIN